MKKLFLSVSILILGFFAFAQTNNLVPVDDKIYEILDYGELMGWCNLPAKSRPYSRHQILMAIYDIQDNGTLSDEQNRFLNNYIDDFKYEEEIKNNIFHARLDNYKNPNLPISLNYQLGLEVLATGGLYNTSGMSRGAFEILPELRFSGDIGKNVSWGVLGQFDITRNPLYKNDGEYYIGSDWYEDPRGGPGNQGTIRTIYTFQNPAYLPYQYEKRWQGQFYFISNLSADGLQGWPDKLGFGFNVNPEATATLFDDTVMISAGRYRREYAAMDKDSSLVLSSRATPFFGIDTQFNIFDYLKYSASFGILEYPNAGYRYTNSTFINKNDGLDDAQFWQNAFAINMIELDTKYFYWDFGSTVVYPKRFEMAYLFPLINYVAYQNHTGDFDNMALFTDIKLQKPGLGSIWFSYYMDEYYDFRKNPLEFTRFMYALQAGVKWVIPNTPFATLTLRYSKVEPYCYTHHSINYAPGYSGYLSENYTNNGESLGYYLPPNSDELLLRFDIVPHSSWNFSAAYQMIRHGADYGTQPVRGSSLYSEMDPQNRSDLRKYFLHDGTYNWMHILSGSAVYNFNALGARFKIYGTAGFIFSYYTGIDESDYDPYGKGEKGSGFSTPIHILDNEEYPTTLGAVLTIGAKVSF